MKLSHSNQRYCYFITLLISIATTEWLKLKLNISNIKPFDVDFRYIIHFKTVEVHFNATFGEYQVLIYRYFTKILLAMLSFKRFKMFLQNISVEWGCYNLWKKIISNYFKSSFNRQFIYFLKCGTESKVVCELCFLLD